MIICVYVYVFPEQSDVWNVIQKSMLIKKWQLQSHSSIKLSFLTSSQGANQWQTTAKRMCQNDFGFSKRKKKRLAIENLIC